MKNYDYLPRITLEKGIKQLVNVFTSTGFTTAILIIFQELFNKDFKITEIQSILDGIGKGVVILVPLISSVISMGMNFRKHYFKK